MRIFLVLLATTALAACGGSDGGSAISSAGSSAPASSGSSGTTDTTDYTQLVTPTSSHTYTAVGGELPHGINAGIAGGVSYATYDAPLALIATDPRRDWRFNARVYFGLRSVRVAGFSPSVTVTYNCNASNVPLYDSERARVRFGSLRTS